MRIIVLLGGNSSERDVSMVSGISVSLELKKRGHQVFMVDTVGEGMFLGSKPEELESLITQMPPDTGNIEMLNPVKFLELLSSPLFAPVDAVFNILHGGIGENGYLQALLELSGIPYTGAGPLASGIAMDKHLSKCIFRAMNLPTPDYIFLKNHHPENIPAMLQPGWNLPLVVKPNREGSSVGVSIVKEWNMLEFAIKKAMSYEPELLIEKYIQGREVTVAVLGDEALPVVEIHPEGGFYSYTCKYTSGKSQYSVPADLPPDVASNLQEIALKAFRAIKCTGFGRVDFRLDENNQPFLLEINTLPGMTPTSLVPKAAKVMGMDFGDLLERIIELGLNDKRG